MLNFLNITNLVSNKAFWIFGVLGTLAGSATFIIIINTQPDNNTKGLDPQITCTQLQNKINDLGRPGIDLIPSEVKKEIRRVMMENKSCSLVGKNWSLIQGKMQRNDTKAIVGDERSILEDFSSIQGYVMPSTANTNNSLND